MLTFRSFSAAVALAGALAIPALAAQTQPAKLAAQQPPPSPAAVSPMSAGGTTAVAKGPAGTLHQTHGMWRSAALVGATVYNGSGQAIGEVSNLLVTPQGKVSMAVLSVGGFLGVDSKLVEVPFGALKFQPSVNNRTAAGTTTPDTRAPSSAALAGMGKKHPVHAWTARANYSVVLPGSSKAALTKMAAFTYGR